jgi:hypothetical protein
MHRYAVHVHHAGRSVRIRQNHMNSIQLGRLYLRPLFFREHIKRLVDCVAKLVRGGWAAAENSTLTPPSLIGTRVRETSSICIAPLITPNVAAVSKYTIGAVGLSRKPGLTSAPLGVSVMIAPLV